MRTTRASLNLSTSEAGCGLSVGVTSPKFNVDRVTWLCELIRAVSRPVPVQNCQPTCSPAHLVPVPFEAYKRKR